jgi:hypothetical protein
LSFEFFYILATFYLVEANAWMRFEGHFVGRVKNNKIQQQQQDFFSIFIVEALNISINKSF